MKSGNKQYFFDRSIMFYSISPLQIACVAESREDNRILWREVLTALWQSLEEFWSSFMFPPSLNLFLNMVPSKPGCISETRLLWMIQMAQRHALLTTRTTHHKLFCLAPFCLRESLHGSRHQWLGTWSSTRSHSDENPACVFWHSMAEL